MFSILGGIFNMWLVLVIVMLMMFLINVLIVHGMYVHAADTALGPDECRTGGAFKLMFAWLRQPRILVVFSLSVFLTMAFGIVYAYWLDLRMRSRKDGAAEGKKAAVRNIYIFNLVTTVMLLVGQLVIKG